MQPTLGSGTPTAPAFLSGRFTAYRSTSEAVMALLRQLSPLVEPLSLDEAYVDLAAAGLPDHSVATVSALGRDLKHRVTEVTGGLTGSVGIGTSKLVAKIASDLDKPDGLVVVAPGMERDLLRPMQVTVIPGVGPATAERLRRIGVHTVAELEAVSAAELVRVLGQAHGTSLFALARAEDDRVSVEDTYDTDHVDRRLLEALLDRQASKVTERLRGAGMSGRTVTVKVRLHDFSTHTRSATLPGPTDDQRTVSRLARTLLGDVDTSGGVRLLGVGVSGLADWIQDDLFTDPEEQRIQEPDPVVEAAVEAAGRRRGWAPGQDVEHVEHGRGWVWGSGRGVVTVRFETAETAPGRVLTFAADDPALQPFSPPAPG
jgi:DNA polymerase-4